MKDRIIKLASRGLTAQQIADDLNCSLEFISMVIKGIIDDCDD